MMQTTKRRINIFPFFQVDAALSPTQSAKAARTGQADLLAVSPERTMGAAVITTRGQRFSIHQIGSMFGSE